MSTWREELDEKRKKQERQRALLEKLASGGKPLVQTGADFVAQKKREEEEQKDLFSHQSPGDRLLALLLDAERRETPKGVCIVRRIEIPVDFDSPATPLDFNALRDSAPATGFFSGASGALANSDASASSPATPAPGSTIRSVAPPISKRKASRRPIDYSDVWPDDLPDSTGRVSEYPDSSDDIAPRADADDWTAPDAPLPPSPADSALDDVPRFRRALERARQKKNDNRDLDAEDPLDRFPPIEYQCRPGFPCSIARPALLDILAVDMEPDRDIALEDILFLDTETTGLAGGTGTFPFLTGVGFFDHLDTDQPVFVVEQYFMEDFCHEDAQLSILAERLAQFSALCTYNGRTFDVPLLRTRYIFNRRSPADWNLPHLDLLHTARRFWRGVLPSVSLGTVERAVLGVRRERDIDGSLIPKIYFQFVRGVRPEQLVPVFDHNVQDIVSLGALLLRLCGYLDNPEHPALAAAGELTGLGLWFHRQGREADAIRCLTRAVALSTDPDEQDRLLSHLAKMHKRAGRWDQAADLWHRLLDRPIGPALSAAVELAKYLEHRVKDADRARRIVEAAIARLSADRETRALFGRPDPVDLRKSPSAWLEDLERRRARLERRAAKNSAAVGDSGGDMSSQGEKDDKEGLFTE